MKFVIISTYLTVLLVFIDDVFADDKPVLACDIIKGNGYGCETHLVTTSDGYILQSQRITGKISKGQPTGPKKQGKVFLLGHGLSYNSHEWIEMEPKYSLAYQLSDKGHDVWLMNLRGTGYGRGHVNNKTMNADTAAFWRFGLDEYGELDFPATVSTVKSITGAKTICYVGHSMGTAIFFIGASSTKSINTDIEKAFILAPSGVQNHLADIPFRKFLLFFETPVVKAAERFAWTQLFRGPSNSFPGLKCSGHKSDSKKKVQQSDCMELLTQLASVGLSFRVLGQYNQLVNVAKGGLYRYSEWFPLKSGEPYALGDVTTNLVIFNSAGDDLVVNQDTLAYIAKLENAKIQRVYIKNPDFAHMDFVIGGKKTQEEVNERIFAMISP